VVTLARGAHITPGNARFFAEPFPVVVQGLQQNPSVTNFRSA